MRISSLFCLLVSTSVVFTVVNALEEPRQLRSRQLQEQDQQRELQQQQVRGAFTVVGADSPYIRLKQEEGQYDAYSWDIAANEGSFFVRNNSHEDAQGPEDKYLQKAERKAKHKIRNRKRER